MDQIECGTEGCDLMARRVGAFGMGDSLSDLEEKFAMYECAEGHVTSVDSEPGTPHN